MRNAGIPLKDTGVTEQQLRNMLDEATNHPARQEFMKRREYFWKLYRGDLLLPDKLDARPKDADFESKENKVFEGVETITAYQTKNNPRYWCVPVNVNDNAVDTDELAQQANGFLRYDYERYAGMRTILQSWVRAKCINGAQPVKLIWDATRKEDFGEGVNRVDVVSWDDFFPYPFVRDLHSAPYVIHRTRKSYLDIIYDRNYGDVAEEALGNRGVRGFWGKAWDRIKEVTGTTDITPDGRSLYDVYEFWIKPYSMIEAETDDGRPIRRHKYPGGLVITMIEDKVVWARANPFNHRRFPFVLMYCYKNEDTADDEDLRGSFYDFMGEVEQAAKPQVELDMVSNAITINTRVIANVPIVVNDEELSIKVENHEWRGGEIFHAVQDADRAVRVLQMPVISPSAYQFAESKRQAVFDSMGITDYMRGTQPTSLSHSSGFMLSLAQEAGYGRTHPKTNLLDQALMELGLLLMSNNQQFRQKDTYFAFSNDGERIHQAWTEQHATTKFTIQVEHGSTTPANDIDRVANAAQLYQMLVPILSLPQIPPYLLELAEWLIRTMKLQGTQSLLQLLSKVKGQQAQLAEILLQQGGLVPQQEEAD